MCDTADDGVGISDALPHELQLRNRGLRSADISALMPLRASWRIRARTATAISALSVTTRLKSGNKILIAIDREYDLDVPHAVAAALREKGAHVDILVADMGNPDRVFDYTGRSRRDHAARAVGTTIRAVGKACLTSRISRCAAVTICLIHGKGGPIPQTEFRYEQIPWLRAEHFLQRSTTYPLDLHLLINKKTWDPIWEYGRGGRARLTDAEGTDLYLDLLG